MSATWKTKTLLILPSLDCLHLIVGKYISWFVPRILTIEGYYKMLGSYKEDRCIHVGVNLGRQGWETLVKEEEVMNLSKGDSKGDAVWII